MQQARQLDWLPGAATLLIAVSDLGAGVLAYAVAHGGALGGGEETGLRLVALLISGLLLGLPVGVGQWLLLRRRLAWADGWLVPLTAALVLGLAVLFALVAALTPPSGDLAWTV